MVQKLRLETEHNPSIFNKDMLLGALVGLLVPVSFIYAPLAAAPTLATIVTGLVTAGAAALGGMYGKVRLEKENKSGKVIGEPSFWNKHTAIGSLLGLKSSLLLSGLAAHLAPAGILAAAHPVGAALAIGGAIATPFLGTFIGGKYGHSHTAGLYEDAQHQQIVRQVSETHSPTVGKAVEYGLEHQEKWADKAVRQDIAAGAGVPGGRA